MNQVLENNQLSSNVTVALQDILQWVLIKVKAGISFGLQQVIKRMDRVFLILKKEVVFYYYRL
jgi:septum formation inhibitor-activating ATPase MinD